MLDIEQVVIRGKLVLGVLLECDGPPDLTGIYSAVTALARISAWRRRSRPVRAPRVTVRAGAGGFMSPCSAAR